MADKEAKSHSAKRLRLVQGFALSSIFLMTYICCSMLYVSNNINTLHAVFTEESNYIVGQAHPENEGLQTLSQDEIISVLSLTEDQLLCDIDMQISASIESAGSR